MSWPAEHLEIVKTMWFDGSSASDIARALGSGKTKNAVIGQVHRNGFVRSPSLPSKVAKPKPINRVREIEPVIAPPVEVKPNSSAKITMRNIRFGQCRWPIGDPQHADFHFCGKKQHDGSPYCDQHTAKAYQRQESVA